CHSGRTLRRPAPTTLPREGRPRWSTQSAWRRVGCSRSFSSRRWPGPAPSPLRTPRR
ncbi:MAG: hypothetical protein AVDCRST_MAG73-3378, partial [uncultured Thermomicrobiales bacterium]